VRTPDNKVNSVVQRYRDDLRAQYDEGEVRAIVRSVFAERLGWDPGQMEIRKNDGLSESELLKVYLPLKRIVSGEPLQYVLGEVRFAHLRLKVDRSVLIPRPETEELVERIGEAMRHGPRRILDIGTGSGCIALALKARSPAAEVIGMDVSDEALKTAMLNAALNDLFVEWHKVDVLDGSTVLPAADLVVSNPPYIPRDEATTMARHVIDHEPHNALFVPGDDPLLFYRAIGEKAFDTMPAGGVLWFEGHPRTAAEAGTVLRRIGWKDVTVEKDLSGKPRFIRATR
jgi:release factor glutamine methyltransferase